MLLSFFEIEFSRELNDGVSLPAFCAITVVFRYSGLAVLVFFLNIDSRSFVNMM